MLCFSSNFFLFFPPGISGVTRGARGRTAPGDALQGGDIQRKNNFLWANLQRIVEKRGRTGKKV